MSLGNTIFHNTGKPRQLHLLLKGTNFQLKVWEALLRVPTGYLASYSSLAIMAGKPNAQRAIGTAMANNDIAFLIPCHRVIKSNGEVGQYRWRTERKLAMLGFERALLPN